MPFVSLVHAVWPASKLSERACDSRQDDLRCAACRGVGRPAGAQPRAEPRVVDELAEDARQRVEVAGRHEPTAVVGDNLRRAAGVGRHDRHARQERFGKHHAERLGTFIGLTEQIDRPHQQRHVTPLAEKAHARLEPEARHLLPQIRQVPVLVRALRGAGDPQRPHDRRRAGVQARARG